MLRDVHFLKVACFNIQHPAQFTDEAIAGLRELFIEHVDRGTGIPRLRRQAARASGVTRVLRPPAERRPTLRPWGLTIADVYLPDQPQGAAGRVRAWALHVRSTAVADG